MENPKERIEDILKRNPYLDAKESFFASSGENDWQAIKRLCYFLYRHHKVLPPNELAAAVSACISA